MKTEYGFCILDQRQLKKLLALAIRHKKDCVKIGVIPPKNVCLVLEGDIYLKYKDENESNFRAKFARVAGQDDKIAM